MNYDNSKDVEQSAKTCADVPRQLCAVASLTAVVAAPVGGIAVASARYRAVATHVAECSKTPRATNRPLRSDRRGVLAQPGRGLLRLPAKRIDQTTTSLQVVPSLQRCGRLLPRCGRDAPPPGLLGFVQSAVRGPGRVSGVRSFSSQASVSLPRRLRRQGLRAEGRQRVQTATALLGVRPLHQHAGKLQVHVQGRL